MRSALSWLMRFLSSCKQLEYSYLIPFCKDLIAPGNLTVDHKIGLSALEGMAFPGNRFFTRLTWYILWRPQDISQPKNLWNVWLTEEMQRCWHFNYLGGFRRGHCTVKNQSQISRFILMVFGLAWISVFFVLRVAVIIELRLRHPKIQQAAVTPRTIMAWSRIGRFWKPKTSRNSNALWHFPLKTLTRELTQQ